MMRPLPSPTPSSIPWLLASGLLMGLGATTPSNAEPPPVKAKSPSPVSSGIFVGVKTQRQVFALTFDDGPNPQWTPQVLAILKQKHVPATFFMVGAMVKAHPRFAKMVAAEGYPIGNHTWSHPLATRQPAAEIDRTDSILQQTIGVKPSLFRPPYGVLDNGLVTVALAEKKGVIAWNDVGADWDKRATAQTIAAKVLRRAKPGGIVLLHDGGGNRSQTVAALPAIIDGLRARGFSFVTVPELLTMGPAIRPEPGVTVVGSPRGG